MTAAPTRWVDRERALQQLWLAATRLSGPPCVASLIGPGGSACGHTFAGDHTEEFPAQLYVDVRRAGPVGQRADMHGLLRHLLVQCGTPEETMPASLQERTALYQWKVRDFQARTGKRVLVVLDNVEDEEQVKGLIVPGGFTLIVADDPMPTVAVETVWLGPLADEHCLAIFDAFTSGVPVPRWRRRQVKKRCRGDPLTAHLEAADVLAASSRGSGRLRRTRVGNRSVHASAARVYERLGSLEARVFRSGVLMDGLTLTAEAAAATLDEDLEEVARSLQQLARLQLLVEAGAGHYTYRPQLREFALECAARQDTPQETAAARRRLLDYLVDFAVRHAQAAHPQTWHVGALFDQLPPAPIDEGAGQEALLTQRHNLLAAGLAALEDGDDEAACHLREASWSLQLKSGHHEQAQHFLEAVLPSAHSLGPATAGHAHVQLAWNLMLQNRYDEAEQHLQTGITVYREAGHTLGWASATDSLGQLYLRQHHGRRALETFAEAGRILTSMPHDDPYVGYRKATWALIQRNTGRALTLLRDITQARAQLQEALDFYRPEGHRYNLARVLTDLADTYMDTDPTPALPLIDEALPILEGQKATLHVTYLRELREIYQPGTGRRST